MKVLIIEDEPAAAKRLTNMLHTIDPEMEVVGPLESVEESATWLAGNPDPDLVLMDIHLTDGSSMELFELLEIRSPVIFTTAFDQYAIEAFKHNAVDYLLKPIKRGELEEALHRYRSRTIGARSLQDIARSLREHGTTDRKILVKVGNSFKVVNLSTARYFYSDHKLTMMIDGDNNRMPIEYSLDKLEKELDPSNFYRISRQVLVNRAAIGNIHIYSRTRLKLELIPGGRVDAIVSKEKVPRFKKWLVKD